MTEIRKLRDSEYPRLKDIEEGTVPDPASSVAVVAEENGHIVGRMLLMCPAHIEGTWVAPEHRKGSTGFRLMKKMEQEAKQLGLSAVFAYAAEPQVENYLERLGYKRSQVSVWSKVL